LISTRHAIAAVCGISHSQRGKWLVVTAGLAGGYDEAIFPLAGLHLRVAGRRRGSTAQTGYPDRAVKIIVRAAKSGICRATSSAAFVASEYENRTRLIREAGIKLD